MINKNFKFKKGISNRSMVLIVSIIIVILVTIVIIVNSKNVEVKYDDKTIKELLNKGHLNMQNFYAEVYDTKSSSLIKSIYIKDNMTKVKTTDEGYILTDLSLEKSYVVNIKGKKIKEIDLKNSFKELLDKYSLFVPKADLSENTKYEYIREEKYQDKDCILIKRFLIDSSTGNELESQTSRVYWIEKSTGYLIGIGDMDKDDNTIIENVYYNNIKINELQDSEFEIPKNFVVTQN